MKTGFKTSFDCIQAVSKTDFTPDLQKSDTAKLILHGDRDQSVSIENSAMSSAKLVQNAALKISPRGSHGMCSTSKNPIRQIG